MIFAVATNNKKKLKEIQRILDTLGHQAKSLSQLGIDVEIDETGTTFAENAIIKAKEIAKISNLATISDDSGLEVDALDGKPGVYTARYAGEHATDDENIDFLLENLKDVPQEKRGAKFVSAVCLYLPNDKYEVCIGECNGSIGFERKGENGFGYDPIFMVGQESFSQISDQTKDEISHRGKALQKLQQIIKEIEKDI